MTKTSLRYFCKQCKKEKLSRTGEYCKKCGYKHRTRPIGLKYNVIKREYFCTDCNKEKSKKGKYCKKCGYQHRTRPNGLKYIIHKENSTSFKNGQVPWNKGFPSGEKKEHPGYFAIHEWVKRWMGKPNKCEKCSSTKNIEWANKSGNYLRDKNDWMRLCKKCHARYDFKKFGARKVFFK